MAGTLEQIGGIECYVATPKGEYVKDTVVVFLTDVLGLDIPNNKVRYYCALL